MPKYCACAYRSHRFGPVQFVIYILRYATIPSPSPTTTAHATALMPVFLTAVVAVPNIPLQLVAMLLCYTSGINCMLTAYASGPSLIY